MGSDRKTSGFCKAGSRKRFRLVLYVPVASAPASCLVKRIHDAHQNTLLIIKSRFVKSRFDICVGRWRNDRDEIDVLALSSLGRRALAGECKFRGAPVFRRAAPRCVARCHGRGTAQPRLQLLQVFNQTVLWYIAMLVRPGEWRDVPRLEHALKMALRGSR